MLSKEQKLRYGQQLRRQVPSSQSQMKEKQEKKRFELMQKRGVKKSPTDPRIVPTLDNQYEHSKQELQKRFETEEYDVFGKQGGGAPNRNLQRPDAQPQPAVHPQEGTKKLHENYEPHHAQDATLKYGYAPQSHQEYTTANYGEKPKGNYDPAQQAGLRQYDKREGEGYQVDYGSGEHYRQIQAEYGRQPPRERNIIERQPTERSVMENSPYDLKYQYQQLREQHPHPQYTQQYPHQYPQQYLQQYPQQHTQQYYQQYPQHSVQQSTQQYMQSQPPQSHSPQTQAPPRQPQPQNVTQQPHNDGGYRQKTMQNEQLMQIHRKGGRNLLLLENITVDQQHIKQRQKQQMRKQLELQIKQSEQRKKKQIERQKREQLQEQRQNQEYLLQQKNRLDQQQRKKNEKQRQLLQQNQRNLQEKRRLEEQAKQKARQQKNTVPAGKNSLMVPQTAEARKQSYTRQVQLQSQQPDETTSEVSSSIVMENAFKTDISKQFFQSEHRKKQQRENRKQNLELVAEQVQRLRDEIETQNQLFQKQIKRVKQESEMVEHEKVRAYREIEDLKNQLKKKIEDDNQRLYKALQRQEELQQSTGSQYEMQRGRHKNVAAKEEPLQVLRPDNANKYVKKKFNSEKEERKYDPMEESNVSVDGLVSLRGESKKIPVHLPTDKLSMSKLSDFARETQYFKNEGSTNKRNSLRVHESIVEEDEERGGSRVNAPSQHSQMNQRDQLDKMLESRTRRKGWAEISSVNDDAIHEIDQLLKKKDKNYTSNAGYNYQDAPDYKLDIYDPSTHPTKSRPPSTISNAGKRALLHQGYNYEGASLNTINSKVGTVGTIDIDNINNRNDARLRQLKKLGVETVNTNEDGQLAQLDEILNRYKDGKGQFST